MTTDARCEHCWEVEEWDLFGRFPLVVRCIFCLRLNESIAVEVGG